MQNFFILGAARSGTTLLRYLLDAHPQVAVPPEWNFTSAIVESYKLALQHYDKSGAENDVGLTESRHQMRSAFRQFLEGFYVNYAYKSAKSVWGASTHTLLDENVHIVHELFGGHAKYIIIVRHPLACAASYTEKFAAGRTDIESVSNATAYWCRVVRSHLSFVELIGPEESILIRYEDLVSDADSTMREILAFLGVDQQNYNINEAFCHPIRGHWGDHKFLTTTEIHKDSIEVWKQRFSRSVIFQSGYENRDLARLSEILGYENSFG